MSGIDATVQEGIHAHPEATALTLEDDVPTLCEDDIQKMKEAGITGIMNL